MRRMVVCLGIGVALIGCNSQDAGDIKRDVGQLAKTGGRVIGNAQLAGRVNAALAQRKGVDMSGIRVETKGGVVTLGGHVRNAEERRRVVETAEGIRGVEKVINNLRIEPQKKK